MDTAESTYRDTPVRLLLAVMATALFVTLLNQTMVNVALPSIRQEFAVSAVQAGWVFTGYTLVYAIGVAIYGRMSDLFSLRRIFSLGLALFMLGALVCALAPSMTVLVAGRVLQGAGASAILALAYGFVAKALPSGGRGAALGLLSSAIGAGLAAGPAVGGLVISATGWRYLFYGTFVFTLVVVVAALRILPDTAYGGDEERSGARRLQLIDLPGGLLLGLAAAMTLFGISRTQSGGFVSPLVSGSLVVAALAALLFWRHIRSTSNPFAPPELFDDRSFLAASAIGFLAQFCFVGSMYLVPLLLGDELSPFSVGLVLTPGAAAIAVISPLAGRLSDLLGTRFVILMSLTMMFFSALFLSSYGSGSLPALIAGVMVVLGVGFAGVNTSTPNAVSATLSRENAGAGMGVYQTFYFLGSGSAPIVLGIVLSLRNGAMNPIYALDAAPYSNAFLTMGLAVLIALAAATSLQRRKRQAATAPGRDVLQRAR